MSKRKPIHIIELPKVNTYVFKSHDETLTIYSRGDKPLTYERINYTLDSAKKSLLSE